MKAFLSEVAAFALRLTGVPLLIREVVTCRKTGIVLYHDPDPEVFERHLSFLARHYSLIPFSALVEALETRDWSAMPPKSLVIHLDDGYARNHRLRDSLARYGVHPTLYLCSGIVGSRRAFWSKLDGGRSERLRHVENRRLLNKLHEEAAFTPEREYPERQALSAKEIGELAESFDFESHGCFHFSLFTLGDDALIDELAASKAAIERLAGRTCEHFSYPFGDHGPREIGAVRVCGYRTARTTLPGWVGPDADRFRLRIVADVPGNCSLNRLRAELTGIPRVLERVTYRLLTRHFREWRQEKLMQRHLFQEDRGGVDAEIPRSRAAHAGPDP